MGSNDDTNDDNDNNDSDPGWLELQQAIVGLIVQV